MLRKIAALPSPVGYCERGAKRISHDAGAQAEVSENSVGEAAVSGILCQREGELARCSRVESLWTKTGLELRVCRRNGPSASLNQDLKKEIRG